MLKNIFLLWLVGSFLFITSLSFAQNKKYTDGYVVLNSGDTLRGKLKKFNKVNSCIQFNFTQSGVKSNLKNKDILAYGREDEIFVKKGYERPFSLGNMTGFMKLIVDGKVRLYKFEMNTQSAPTMGADGMMSPGYSRNLMDYYLEKNGILQLVRQFTFRKDMALYFSDNKDLAMVINKRKLRYENMIEIVKLYNLIEERKVVKNN